MCDLFLDTEGSFIEYFWVVEVLESKYTHVESKQSEHDHIENQELCQVSERLLQRKDQQGHTLEDS